MSLSNTTPHGSGLGTCQRGIRKLLRGGGSGPFQANSVSKPQQDQ